MKNKYWNWELPSLNFICRTIGYAESSIVDFYYEGIWIYSPRTFYADFAEILAQKSKIPFLIIKFHFQSFFFSFPSFSHFQSFFHLIITYFTCASIVSRTANQSSRWRKLCFTLQHIFSWDGIRPLVTQRKPKRLLAVKNRIKCIFFSALRSPFRANVVERIYLTSLRVFNEKLWNR